MKILGLAPLTLLFTVACSDAETPATDGGSSSTADAGFVRSDSGVAPPMCPAYTPKAGRATGSFLVGVRTTISDLPELGCRVLRDRDGRVAGYLAAFAGFTPDPIVFASTLRDRAARIEVLDYGAFAGDGVYADAMVNMRAADGSGTSTGGMLTLTDGGRTGTFTQGDITLSFTCDPTDDLSTAVGSPVVEQAGRMIVTGERGVVMAFDDIVCSGTDSLTISWPAIGQGCTPSMLDFESLTTQRLTAPGEYGLQLGSQALVDFWSLAFAGAGDADKLTITQLMPWQGSIVFGRPVNPRAYSATFRCR